MDATAFDGRFKLLLRSSGFLAVNNLAGGGAVWSKALTIVRDDNIFTVSFRAPREKSFLDLQTDGFKLNHYQIFEPIDICLYTKYLDFKVTDDENT